MNALRLSAAVLVASLASSFACATSAPTELRAEFGDFDAAPPPVDAGPQNSFGEAGKPIEFTGECAEETKQIFVLGTDKALYRFNPETLEFKHIGVIGCPSAAGTFSMAIDRRGTAWIEFTDGRLFAVSTFDATCKPTPFVPGQTGFTVFGMGYAMNDDGKGETLYAAGAGLAALDTTTFELEFLGSLSFGRTELTGLDNKLFAFSVGSGVIAGLNKTNAATEVIYRTTAINQNAAFAFAQWGGDFWVFTGNDMSIVTRYTPATDTSTVVVQNTGMLIVGAGSSTCAPTKPVK